MMAVCAGYGKLYAYFLEIFRFETYKIHHSGLPENIQEMYKYFYRQIGGKISCEDFNKNKNFPKYRRDYLLYNDRTRDVVNLNVCMYFTIIELLEGNMGSNFVKGIVTYLGPKI